VYAVPPDCLIVKRRLPQVCTYLNSQETSVRPCLTGFLEKNTSLFMKELWGLLANAQAHPDGIPQFYLDEKKNEVQAAVQTKVGG